MNLDEVLECIVIRLLRLSPWRPPPPDGWRVSSVRCSWMDPGSGSPSGGGSTSDSVVRDESIYENTKIPESTSAPQKVEVPLSGFTPDKLRLMEVPGINPPPPRSVSNGPSAE